MRDALDRAQRQNIVVFAATSNEGLHDAVAWPAKEPRYSIGIHSSIDFGGRKSDFTAKPFDGANFMVVGENITAQWPTRKGGGFRLCTGSSFATPVATAVGALVLAFAWQKMCHAERCDAERVIRIQDIQTNHGMSKVLRAISTNEGDIWPYIPSSFWMDYYDVDSEHNIARARHHAWNIMEKALRM